MTHERLRLALARRESIRRSRDFAWIAFGAFASGALLFLVLFTESLGKPGAASPVVFVYLGVAVLALGAAVQFFLNGWRLNRRLEDVHGLTGSASD